MGTRKRTTIPYKVRQIAVKHSISIKDAMSEYNRIQQARVISSEESIQEYALSVSRSINQFKLNKSRV